MSHDEETASARQVVPLAARFAYAALKAAMSERPDLLEALRRDTNFTVKIVGILGASPRVVLCAAVGDKEDIELAHVDLVAVREVGH